MIGELKDRIWSSEGNGEKGRGDGKECGKICFFQAGDSIRDFCLSRGLGGVYKKQGLGGGGGSHS